MKQPNKRTTGGLVLKTEELRNILNQDDAVGLGFGLYKKGVAENVDLKIYKMLQVNGELWRDEREIEYKRGASDYWRQSTAVNNYKFKYLKQLISCEFDFGYIDKRIFLELMDTHSEPEVFISGMAYTHEEKGQKEKEYFNLKIWAREEVVEEMENVGPLPPFEILVGCPPVWRPKDIEPESVK